MAKSKALLLKKAEELGLKLSEKLKVTEIEKAIKQAQTAKEPVQEVVAETEETIETDKVTKAGKHSAKALREAEEEAERQELIAKRKSGEVEASKPQKGPEPKTRSKLERRSKNYRAVSSKIDRAKLYSVKDAVQLAIETTTTKFDSSLELHVRLAIDTKQSDQNVRDSIVLPNGTGKKIIVAAFVSSEDEAAVKAAGADKVGEDMLIEEIKNGKIDFDLLIATPKTMAKLGQLAKTLGPKGLMPSPKSGTVTNDPAKAVKEAKAGKIEYRADDQGIIHCAFGKVSFGAAKLAENLESLLASIKANKPASVKDTFILSIFITTSMGPSIRLEG